ncbi:MAG: 3'(2'),5'-bisphosphate nucleotidase CysQ [Alphaproteobacteria bacterium]|nr:3'(2'),5'-bisphosphate nucleotidase CysQ [Alphaproteobacteria bacterium]MDP6566190.1 3'(2'),5'-bisphosphate nucleotidase CysQ [Alphaproteobacteria bacterium]MDP6815263.1 3'(2'),5'-bisphosphate nucleotidase CysQ [Alphaproteobacteria bacterium]
MSRLAEDHDLIVAAVREGGALALDFFRNGFEHWHKGPNDPVSEADHAVDELLHQRLTTARPDYGWLSEETEDDPSRVERAAVWVVDPIDGTRAFIEKRKEFTVCVALVEGGRPTAAAVYNPAEDELFDATLGGGARLNGEPIRVSSAAGFEGARLLTGRNLFKRAGPLDRPDQVTIHMVNSIAYRMCLVAQGRYDACISLSGKSDWDIAAAELILAEAGGVVTDARSDDFIYNLPDPRHKSVIAAGPALHARIMQFIDRVERPPGATW